MALRLCLFFYAAIAHAATVSILEFTTERCTDCSVLTETLKRVQSHYGQEVSMVVKQIPANDPNHVLLQEAKALGVEVMPTLFINGRRLQGKLDESALAKIIDLSLGKTLAEQPVTLDLSHAPLLGEAGKPEITVFSDFQCPYCATIAPVLSELAKHGEASVRFKNFPLPFHAKAPAAHRAALAAAQQGKFWEMHDRMFASPGKLDSETLEQYARDLHLDLTKFQAVVKDGVPAVIAADVAEGERVGVEGTPSLFINGRQFFGRPSLDGIRAALASLQTSAPAATQKEPPLLRLSQPENASARLEWFFDANSELSRSSFATIRQVMSQFPNVEVIARHFPLPFHANAPLTHQALALAAGEGKFWSFLDNIFNQPIAPDAERLKSISMRVGLNSAEFAEKLDSRSRSVDVERDLLRGRELEIRGVPTFVLNGKRLEASDSAGLMAAIASSQSTELARVDGAKK